VEPRIQYAKTEDGVSIAYAEAGVGPPVILMPSPPFSHIQVEWEWPLARRTYEKLAERRRLIRYDCRGAGLSDRECLDFSLEAALLDLSAVVERLALDRLALVAYVDAGPTAIAYAVRNAERVTHLVLWGTYARGGFEDATQVQGLYALLERDWPLFTETMAHAMFGWSAAEHGSWLAQFWAKSTTPDAVKAAWTASFGFDVTELLSGVLCPTLVLHPSHVPWMDLDQARLLASRIPQARLTVLEGLSGVLLFDESGTTIAAIDEFLGEGEVPAATAAPLEAGTFRTILFTDVEGSTAMTQRLGDARAREVLREHERIVREALKAHGGAEVKTMGDGFMASFGSATKALECAIAIQRAFDERNAYLPAHPEALEGRAEPQPPAHASTGSARADRDVGASPEPVRVRIGLNAGEPVAEEGPDGRGDLFGTAVNLAARIAGQAQGGEVLASDVVRQLVAGKGFLFADRGDAVLRGFEDPVRLYEVRWREE